MKEVNIRGDNNNKISIKKALNSVQLLLKRKMN